MLVKQIDDCYEQLDKLYAQQIALYGDENSQKNRKTMM